MFNKEQVDKIIELLQAKKSLFVSEAHFQMSFIFEAFKQYGEEYDFIPEYPIVNPNDLEKQDEIDLVILDKKTKEKTFIEFKHKTKNNTKKTLVLETSEGIKFAPKYHAAQDLGRYDCWHDIERLEIYKRDGESTNGFFIFITNDNSYWESDGGGKYGNAFNMKPTHYNSGIKSWINPNVNSVSNKRLKAIDIQNDYDFDYDPYFTKIGNRNGEFKILTVEI